mmetsp:Transcript_58331/g.131371  ORF Transcript_58331/g.131371 Transcript_58331/m.131371 type:complete len:260 (+) Transcript_58331:2391-3170(+)
MRRDVDAPLHVGVAHEHPKHSKLSADRLAACRRGADQAVVVCGVECAERLRLNGVEDLQPLGGVELLGLRVPQRRQWQRLQVKQLCVRWVLLGQDQVPEGDGQQRLGVDPTVRSNPDEVLRWKRLRDGHREVEGMFLLCAALLQHEHLLVEDLLPVHVLNKDPERLRPSVHARVPLKVGRDRELHHQARTRDGLHICAEVELRELVDQLVDGLAHLREPDELSNLGTGQVIVSLPSEVLLLHLPEDILGQTLEVPEWRL